MSPPGQAIVATDEPRIVFNDGVALGWWQLVALQRCWPPVEQGQLRDWFRHACSIGHLASGFARMCGTAHPGDANV